MSAVDLGTYYYLDKAFNVYTDGLNAARIRNYIIIIILIYNNIINISTLAPKSYRADLRRLQTASKQLSIKILYITISFCCIISHTMNIKVAGRGVKYAIATERKMEEERDKRTPIRTTPCRELVDTCALMSTL